MISISRTYVMHLNKRMWCCFLFVCLIFLFLLKVCLHLNICLAKSSEWILKKLMFFCLTCSLAILVLWECLSVIVDVNGNRTLSSTTLLLTDARQPNLLLSIFIFFLCIRVRVIININIWLFCVIFTCSSPSFSLFLFGARPTFVTNWNHHLTETKL